LICIAAFYRFIPLSDREGLRARAIEYGTTLGLKGSLLVATEGVNGTLSGDEAALDLFIAALGEWVGAQIKVKKSHAEKQPFYKYKVRLKKEIVTFGHGANPTTHVGQYVKPRDWNALIQKEDVVVIDTRNDYEIKAGTFENAIDPRTTTFTEFARFADENLAAHKHKTIAMFCTGGIRCEKATSYLVQQGFEDVRHLEGGILQYLEDVEESSSLWRGECFVFDHRVTVDHALLPGSFSMCHVCGWPLDDDDKTHEQYELGVSCAHCFAARSDSDKSRARERQKQIELAKKRGEVHVGARAKSSET